MGITCGFNPTLVRFCPYRVTLPPYRVRVSIPPWFDFAAVLRVPFDVHTLFQSHLGSILPLHGCASSAAGACFNPTLVRFCRSSSETTYSHCHGFNPTLVRFCRQSETFSRHGSVVSIPPWFDFAANIVRFTAQELIGFNPTLVRFCPGVAQSAAAVGREFQSHLGSILPF